MMLNMYITGKKSGSDFTLLSMIIGLDQISPKEEKDENVKTAFEGINAATPERFSVKYQKKKKQQKRKASIENRC